MSEYYGDEYIDDDLEEFDDMDNGYHSGRLGAIRDVGKWLADDWKISSRETLPKIFWDGEEQDELWESLVLARERKLKHLQSEVKKLEKKLEKLKEKNKEKK